MPAETVIHNLQPKNNIVDFSHPKKRREVIGKVLEEKLPPGMSSGLKAGIHNIFDGLPFKVAELFLACSFIQGLLQCLQEALLQLFPKVAAGLAIRKSLKMGAYEATLEMPEWINFYLLPTLFAATMAKFMAKHFKLPHFEALNQRMYNLEKQAGQKIEIGTLSKTTLHLNAENLNRLYVSKFMLFIMTALLSMAGGAIVPAIRLPIFQKLFGTLDFYKICGLPSKNDNPKAAQEAMKQAIKNIKYALLAMALGIPSLMALSASLGRLNYAKIKIPQAIKTLSKIFDLGGNFGLSKVLVSFGVVFAGLYTYPSVALNPAEKREMKYRVLFFSVPCVLFFKQLVGNLVAFATALAFKAKYKELRPYRVVDSPMSYFKEAKSGKRDIFDLGLVGIGKHEGLYTGRLATELKELQKTKPHLYKQYLGSLHFAEHWFPFLWAIVTGFAINGLTYNNTVKAHEQDNNDSNPKLVHNSGKQLKLQNA